MRLISATIRNYRVHRELTVQFDRTLTVIGGANECGKSTLVEALHRALFMKARGNAEHHRLMLTEGSVEVPEVRLEFEAGGRVWQLVKSFGAGTRGRVSLATTGAGPLVSDEAERRLAELLGNPTDQSGKAMLDQWRHLWVWQGTSGDHPGSAASSQQDSLMRRLQLLGGSALLQSEHDQKIATHFAERVAATFSQSGRPRAGSELERAEREKGDRAAIALTATEHWESRETLAGELSDLRERMRKLEDERHANGVQLEADRSALEALEKLEEDLKALGKKVGDALSDKGELEAKLDRMVKLRVEIDDAQSRLVPLQQEIASLESKVVRLDDEESVADAELEAGRSAARKADLLSQWWRVLVEETRAAEEFGRCSTEYSRLQERRDKVAKAEVQLDGKLALDKKTVERLRRLENDRRTAAASVDAMAAEVEVVALDQRVSVDGKSAAAGDRTLLTREGEILIGEGTRIRVRPGGGESLSKARSALAQAAARLREELDERGLADLESAEARHIEWSDAQARVASARVRLQELDPSVIEAALNKSQVRHTSAIAEKKRLAGLVGEISLESVGDPSELEVRAQAAQLQKTEVEGREDGIRVRRDELRGLRDIARKELGRSKTLSGEIEQSLLTSQSQLSANIESNGRPEEIRQRVESMVVQIASLQEKQQAEESRRFQMDPDGLRQRRERLVLRQQRLENDHKNAREAAIRAEAKLQVDGDQDPRSTAEMAIQQLRVSEARWEGLRLQGEAFQLLHQLFESEQSALARKFTKPFEERLSGYLSRTFGPGTEGQITLGPDGLTGLSLSRPGLGSSCFSFESLSGGTREQVGVAVRLAMAEVLAGEHGECLPVVLDDAFAYSDPDRVQRIQDMLFLAGRRGLQVIVLTCTPLDYAGAGGKEIQLRRPTSGSVPIISSVPSIHAPGASAGNDGSGTSHSVEGENNEDQSFESSVDTGVVAFAGPVTAEMCGAFLAELPEDGSSVANAKLRQTLGWDESQYEAVRKKLVDQGSVQRGRGRGGTVYRAS